MKENNTTIKVDSILRHLYNKAELSKELGITRPTLDSRLSGKTDWKVLEIKWINRVYEKVNRLKNVEVK